MCAFRISCDFFGSLIRYPKVDYFVFSFLMHLGTWHLMLPRFFHFHFWCFKIWDLMLHCQKELFFFNFGALTHGDPPGWTHVRQNISSRRKWTPGHNSTQNWTNWWKHIQENTNTKKRKYKCELKKWRNTTNIDKFKLTHGYELKLAKLAENKIKKWTTGLAQ